MSADAAKDSFLSAWLPAEDEWVISALQKIESGMLDIKRRYDMVDATVVSLRDECKQLLKSVGLMETDLINSKVLGVHPGNRYGDGVVPTEVLGLIADIFGNGFSDKALDDPTAFGMPPSGHPRCEWYKSFNRKITEGF